MLPLVDLKTHSFKSRQTEVTIRIVSLPNVCFGSGISFTARREPIGRRLEELPQISLEVTALLQQDDVHVSFVVRVNNNNPYPLDTVAINKLLSYFKNQEMKRNFSLILLNISASQKNSINHTRSKGFLPRASLTSRFRAVHFVDLPSDPLQSASVLTNFLNSLPEGQFLPPYGIRNDLQVNGKGKKFGQSQLVQNIRDNRKNMQPDPKYQGCPFHHFIKPGATPTQYIISNCSTISRKRTTRISASNTMENKLQMDKTIPKKEERPLNQSLSSVSKEKLMRI